MLKLAIGVLIGIALAKENNEPRIPVAEPGEKMVFRQRETDRTVTFYVTQVNHGVNQPTTIELQDATSQLRNWRL